MAKASRVAARTMNTMKTVDERLSAIEQQLGSILALLHELQTQGVVSPDELADVLESEPIATTKDEHAEAFAEARHVPVGSGRKPRGGR